MHNNAFILFLRTHCHYFFWWSIASIISYIPLIFLSYMYVRAVVLLFLYCSESSRMFCVRILLWPTHSMSIAVKLFSPLTHASKVIFLNMLLIFFSEYWWHDSSPSLLFTIETPTYIFTTSSLSLVYLFFFAKLKAFLLYWCPIGLSSHLSWWYLFNCWDLWTHVFHQFWATSCVDILFCLFFSLCSFIPFL